MGILIILGVITVISTIIYRMSNNEFVSSSNLAEYNIKLNIPSDSVIKSITSDKLALTVFYEIGQDYYLKTIDINSGKAVRSIKINP
jgi:hypothetical protein